MRSLAHLTSLTSLNLDDTAITDAGLTELARLTKLDELILGDKVTEKGVARLQEALPECHIVR